MFDGCIHYLLGTAKGQPYHRMWEELGAAQGQPVVNHSEMMLLLLLGMSKTLPGLHNFYMAGQWVEPGGMVALSAMSGRNVIQMLCQRDKKPFVTSTP